MQDPVDPQNDTHMQAAALTCRLAMVAAAALASEEASTTTAEPSVAASAGDGEGSLPMALPLLEGQPGSFNITCKCLPRFSPSHLPAFPLPTG